MREQTGTMQAGEVKIRVLIFRDPQVDAWIAQGLEHDICVQSKTIEDVSQAFENAVAAHIAIAIDRGEEPLASIPQAPASFFKAFRNAAFDLNPAVQRRQKKQARVHNRNTFHPIFRMTDRLATVPA